MISRAPLLALALLAASPRAARAEEWARGVTSRSVLFSGGRASQLDTYLSPMEYSGPQFGFLTRGQRMTRWRGERVSFQNTFQGVFSHSDNPAGTASDWGGRLAYDAGWHYHWLPAPGLRLMAGGLVGADAGFLYNDRNGNNPAQGRASVDLSASLAAEYGFRLWRRRARLSCQADLPVAGAMFSPRFGQSYYEISQGGWDRNVRFTCPGNALSLRLALLADIRMGRGALCVGYLWDARQSRVNGIKTHDIGHSALLGWRKTLGRA